MNYKNLCILALCISAILYLLAMPIGYFIFYTRYTGTIYHLHTTYHDVEIRREKSNGIPHIKGDTLLDCYYGLGYVHAEDRMF